MSKNKKLTMFGKAVKKRLIDKDLNIKNLAEYLGIDPRYLSDILYGRRSGAKYIKDIAEYLDIDIEKYIA